MLFIAIGVIALAVFGGSTNSLPHDVYRLVAMFALNGEWAFDDGVSIVLPVLAFVAPLAAIVGIVELLGRSFFGRLKRDFQLSRLRGHVVVFGLSEESLLLMQGILKADNPPSLLVVASGLNEAERG
ncbi:MAG: hypothetical protein HRU11_05885 [Parvularculaceae bacterium]|nr:hypothetical protein [Parvularculaceae bacterium]